MNVGDDIVIGNRKRITSQKNKYPINFNFSFEKKKKKIPTIPYILMRKPAIIKKQANAVLSLRTQTNVSKRKPVNIGLNCTLWTDVIISTELIRRIKFLFFGETGNW